MCMRKIKMSEIEKLYRDCHIETDQSCNVRTSLNKGNMNNQLNTGCCFMNKNTAAAIVSNTTISVAPKR